MSMTCSEAQQEQVEDVDGSVASGRSVSRAAFGQGREDRVVLADHDERRLGGARVWPGERDEEQVYAGAPQVGGSVSFCSESQSGL